MSLQPGFFDTACTGAVCRDGATTATNSFYFSFSSIYSYPTEQMYLTFFLLSLICYSAISLLELSFYSSIFHIYIYMHVQYLYPFQTISVTCFIHTGFFHDFFLFVFIPPTATNEMRGTKIVWQPRKKMDRKLKDKAFENYSSTEKRM